MKRALDIVIAFSGLVFALPLMGLIAVLVGVDLGRPVLYRQKRPGLNGELFEIFKFRTMRDASDASDAKGNPLSDRDRLSRLGMALRASSLDELPELWNVLKGDMSLVGPRPLLPEYLPLYSSRQLRRHETRPGLTGWAQVNGRNSLSWEERFELDVWYVDNQSFLLDIKILLMTIAKVVSRSGITEAGEATMSKFTGNRP